MEKTVERAREMVMELVASGLTMSKISDGTGVNPTTLGWIKNGKIKKIKGMTFDRIWDYWSENPGPENAGAGRDEGVSEGDAGSPDDARTESAGKDSAAPSSEGTKLVGTKLEQSFQMVKDLLRHGQSSAQIIRATGIAPMTISMLRNEKSKRVTNKVYDRLRDYWRQQLNGKVTEAAGESASAEAAQAPVKKLQQVPGKKEKQTETSYAGFV
ncbi:MAG: hypothetical protein RRA94_10040, partial [Bacteroidota bacterium]|nr:hypothetical protein [Bacteroidota bacterium]